MVYVLKGDAKTLFATSGLIDLFRDERTKEKQIEELNKDIDGVAFLGDQTQLDHFRKIWKNGKQVDLPSYAQGNMNGKNLGMLFEAFSVNSPQTSNVAIAYIDENNLCCSLMITYDKEDPRKAMIGIVKGTNLSLDKQEVFILSNEPPIKHDELVAESQKAKSSIEITEVNPSASFTWAETIVDFEKHIASKLISNIVQSFCTTSLKPDNSNILNLIAQTVDVDRQLQDIDLLNKLSDTKEFLAILYNGPLQQLAASDFVAGVVKPQHITAFLDKKHELTKMLMLLFTDSELILEDDDDKRMRNGLIKSMLNFNDYPHEAATLEQQERFIKAVKIINRANQLSAQFSPLRSLINEYQQQLYELALATIILQQPVTKKYLQTVIDVKEQPILTASMGKANWVSNFLAKISFRLYDIFWGQKSNTKESEISKFFSEKTKLKRELDTIDKALSTIIAPSA